MHDLTCAITNFGRPERLRRLIESAKAAGFQKFSVSAMKHPTECVEGVLLDCLKDVPDFRVARNIDLGCHTSWLMAAYHASTPYIWLAHDDDGIVPEARTALNEIVLPNLRDGSAGFASWRAVLRYDDGNTKSTEYIQRPTGVWDSADLEAFLLRPKRLSLSPIVSIFRRDVLIHALKESDYALTDFLHSGMQLGTEILCYLRHCSEFKKWLFVDQQLSEYGAHGGSGTVKYEQAGNIARLAKGYDQARAYYAQNKTAPTSYEAKILLVSAPFQSADAAEQQRFDNARRTWDFHFNQGTILDFPIRQGALPRSSMEIGDNASVPFLRDIFDHGCAHAMPEDVVAYANLDIGFTTVLPEAVVAKVKECGVCVVWRRTMPFNPDHPLKTCKNGQWDGGVDFIAVSPAWWKEHREKIPDMVIAATNYDYVFRTYAERITGSKCYLADGIFHAPHDSFMSRHGLGNARQKHNHALARKFFSGIGDQKVVSMLDRQRIQSFKV